MNSPLRTGLPPCPCRRQHRGSAVALIHIAMFARLDLWVHPIVLGVGKKVFDGGAVPTNLTLLEPPVAGAKGTVYLRYEFTGGTPATSDMAAHDRGVGWDA